MERGIPFRPETGESEEVINISSRGETEAERALSNFAHRSFELDGKRYESVEGFWQGLKFPEGSQERDQESRLFGPAAKKAGRKAAEVDEIEYQGRKIKSGSSEHHDLMRRAVRAKLEQNPEVREMLLATGERKITHVLRRPDGSPLPDSKTIPGAVFAQILMDLREEFRE